VKRNLTVTGVVLIAAIVGALLARDAHPVLWRAPFSINQLSGEDHNYVLFNPFRDRSPERAAAPYLEAMRRGSCKDAEKFTANVVLPNRFTCEQMQSGYRKVRNLFVQRLRDRRKDGNVVVLYYSNTGYEGNWVAVRQPGGEWGGDWRVVEFNKTW
jgi:hypothetical protein